MASSLVGQFQVTTFTSPVAGTSPIDANTVRSNDNTLKTAYDLHDLSGILHFQDSPSGSRPVAATVGLKWLDNDTYRVYYDDGTAWHEIAYAVTGGAASFTSVTFTTKLISTTALATPSALVATTFEAFASTVSGAVLMGYGTTNDVALMNRAGTVVLGIGPNTTVVNISGTLTATGSITNTAPGNSAIATAVTGNSTTDWKLSINAGANFFRLGVDQTAGTFLLASGIVQIYSNSTLALTISAAQLATFAAGVSATTGTFSSTVSMTALTATTGTFSNILQVTRTAQQASFRYDASNVFSVSVASTGVATLGASGTAPGIVLASSYIDLTSGPTYLLQSTPASAAATGVAGTVTFDSSFAYFCVSANTWKRVAIATW